MKHIRLLSRVFTGIVFIFSGFVKMVDPLGSAYKFSDYFHAFGLGFLEPVSLPLAILLSSIEVTMGIALLLSYRMRVFSWLVMIFMSFFTVLTFFLAIYNPVTDCGCFGDALILTNWQTFWKNIVIQVFVVLVLLQRNNYPVVTGKSVEWAVILVVFIFSSSVSLYSYNHLPLLDFRPYSTGSNIPHKMIVPPDVPADVYETRLIYKNKSTGKDEVFSLETIPVDTNAYSFVDAQSVLISKGYEPPIHDFYVSTRGGNDITDIIIHDPGFSFLLISHNLSAADKNGLIKADEYAKFAKLYEDVRFYCITASSDGIIDGISQKLGLSYDFYQADEIALKTIIRSNPGLVLLKNGTILGKWHFNDFPAFGLTGDDFREIIVNYPFSPGSRLNRLNVPPPGADADVYETVLYYRNLTTDSISAFHIDDFPQSPDWLFVNSESNIVRKGYHSPLSEFKAITTEGLDISNDIITGTGNIFLLLTADPMAVNIELLNRVNNLSVIAAATDTAVFHFFGITALSHNDLISFTDEFISPVLFARADAEFVRLVAGDGVAFIWIRDGMVMEIVKNENIPEPYEFSEFLSKPPTNIDPGQLLLPAVISSSESMSEKRIVYIFFLGFVAFGLFLRAFFENRKF